MNNRPDFQLSPEGTARREAMIADMVDLAAQTHRRRRLRRRALALGGTVGVAALFVALLWPRGGDLTSNTDPIANSRRSVSPPALNDAQQGSRVIFTLLSTDPAAVDRYRRQPASRVDRLDDDALIDTLASIHRPAKLIRDGDRVRLSAPVTDTELGL